MIRCYPCADMLIFETDKRIKLFDRALWRGVCIRRSNGDLYYVWEIVGISPNWWVYYLRKVVRLEDVEIIDFKSHLARR